MWWNLGSKSSVNSPLEKSALNLHLSLKTSPHSSLQENRFVTWNALWEYPCLTTLTRPILDSESPTQCHQVPDVHEVSVCKFVMGFRS